MNDSPQKQYGKGSKRREENFKAVQDNWGKINWSKKPKKITKYKCDCHLHKYQVCDICQGTVGKDKLY